MWWSKGLSPGGGVGVEQAALAAGGHRHADRVADALAERAGGGLDAGGVAVLRVARGLAAPGAQRLEVVELEAVAGEVELDVQGEAASARRRARTGRGRASAGRPGRAASPSGTAGTPTGARLIAVPGWPLPTFCTASMARTRTVSTARWSRSVQSSSAARAGPAHGVRRVGGSTGARAYSGLGSSTRHERLTSPEGGSRDRRGALDVSVPRRPRRLAPDEQPLTVPAPAEVSVTAVDRPRVRAAADRRHRRRARRASAAYVGLTKPRDHRAAAAHHGPGDVPRRSGASRRSWLVVATVVGGTLSAGSANALNCVFDRDIDEQMRRTRRRPLPRHIVSPAGGAGLRARARRGLDAVARAAASTGSPPGWRSAANAVLRRRLHDAAQAAHHPEHRLGRRRRLHAGADRLDRGHRRARLGAGRAVPGRLLLDAAALLGAGDALPRGLRRGATCRCCRWSRRRAEVGAADRRSTPG